MADETPPGSGLLRPLFVEPAVAALVSDRALLQAMLDVERALAAAGARAGLVPAAAAAAIGAACTVDRYDVDDIGRRATASGTPVIPLVADLAAAAGPVAASWVHRGATTQDVLDTAWTLVATRVGARTLAALEQAASACAGHADRERDTVLAARTLGQHALPTTFGLKAAGWLVALWSAYDGLDWALRRCAAELGGAAGTLAALGDHAQDIARLLAEDLGLAEPVLPWHTDRTRLGHLAGALGTVAGVLGKVAVDVTLLAQTEVGEVGEGGADRGGSSAMPHKRNPVDAMLLRAATLRVPGLVATLLAAMAQENERGVGTWQAEWEPLGELLGLVGSAAERGARLLAGLVVHPDRMAANLALTRGLPMSERVADRLAGPLGRLPAQALVRELVGRTAAEGRDLGDVLAADERVTRHVDPAELAGLMDPRGYLGAAPALIDRALALHETRLAAARSR